VPWTNGALPLFHGTDDAAARAILHSGIDLRRCSPVTDFGRGFYTTTNLDQAKNWARIRAARAGSTSVKGAVIAMDVSRDWLATLQCLVFVRDVPEAGYPDFVRHCRGGRAPHRLSADYDAVYGPVAMWQDALDYSSARLFTIADCDQISFHSATHTGASGPLLTGARVFWTEP
jgi:hypothetical protein